VNRSNFIAADGDGYERQMGRWSRRLAVSFLDFAGLAQGDHVLDMGCGTGSLTGEIASRSLAGNLIGVDYAGSYVGHAAEEHGDAARFAVADGAELPFAANRFDRALSLLVLHFVPDADRATQELLRVTRPGGTVAAAIWDAGGGVVVNRLFCDTAAAVVSTGADFRRRIYNRPITQRGALAALWQRAELVDIEETTLTVRMDFDSFDDFWAPYLGDDGPYAAFVATLDGSDRARLAAAVREAYLAGNEDGARSFAASAWAIRGGVT
jgi:SAM-dependent methyltransferase